MFHVLGENFKIFLKIFPRFLCMMIVMFLDAIFPGTIIIWVFKISVVLLLVWRWFERIRKRSSFKFFKPSFLCTGLFWGIIIAIVAWKGVIGGSMILLLGSFWIAGIILTYKALNNSFATIQKYYPQVKKVDVMDVHSPDEYFELYSRAENLDREISGLKKEAPSAVKEALRQREAGKLIFWFHLEMMFFVLFLFWYTPWMT